MRARASSSLWVYKADRIGRDVLVNEMAARALHDELGVGVHGVAESIELGTPIGRAMFTFQSAIGKLERENTLRRSRDATHRLAREGTWLGGIVPYGYRVEGKDREARLVLSTEVDPRTGLSEVEVMQLVYRWSGDEGVSCIEIANRLNARNVPTSYTRDGRKVPPAASLANAADFANTDDAKVHDAEVDATDGQGGNCAVDANGDNSKAGRGKRKVATRGVWRAGRVRNMLVETTYKGTHTWGKRRSRKAASSGAAGSTQAETVLIERAVPAIVDAALWARAQETLRRNRLCRPDIVKRKYLLRGLIKCAHCGLTYVGTVKAANSNACRWKNGRDSKCGESLCCANTTCATARTARTRATANSTNVVLRATSARSSWNSWCGRTSRAFCASRAR